MKEMNSDLIERAVSLADEHLFPNALETDRAGEVPSQQLDLLRESELYGIFSPVELGGLHASPKTQWAIIEALSGGCLTTSFVWAQHAGPSKAAAETTGPMREKWGRALATGEARGGVAFAHLNRPGAPMLLAEPDGDNWLLSGSAPFVTGWGHIDVVLTAARYEDLIIWAMIDARESESLSSKRLSLAAVDSATTAELTFTRHYVPEATVTAIETFESWAERYKTGLRANGSNPLGVAARSIRLLGSSPFEEQLVEAREHLDSATSEELPLARAVVGELCVRSAAALVAQVGGSAMTIEQQAQRLAREALFLLVQGQTIQIKKNHLQLLTNK